MLTTSADAKKHADRLAMKIRKPGGVVFLPPGIEIEVIKHEAYHGSEIEV
jgi:hypothetical protein